jgi:hypothetical protein
MNTNNNKSNPARGMFANAALLLVLFMAIAAMVPADIPLSPIHSAWGGGMGSCGGDMSSSTSRLDAVDTSVTPPASIINTKVAGTAFSIKIVALQSNGSVATGFGCNVTVTVLGSTTAGGVGSSCASGTTLKSTTVTLTNGVGTLSVANSDIPNVWRDARVKLFYSGGGMGSGDITSCSQNNFAVRPDHFNLSVTDATWATAGTTRTLNSTTAPPGGTIHKAGQPFTIRATAVNGLGATTSQYSGSPTVNAATACVLPASCSTGTLSLGSWSSSSGVATTSTASYSEVGTLTLNLEDQAFANADSGESGETSVEQFIPTTSPLGVGRFVPDHFDVTASALINRSDLASGSTFTYMDEPMKVSFTMEAQSASNARTSNYYGSFALLDPTLIASYGFGAVDTAAPTNLSTRLTVVFGSVARPAWSTGTLAVTVPFVATVSRLVSTNITPDGPYDSFKIGINPVDSDGVAGALDLDVVSGGGNDHMQVGATKIRFGRMTISSVYGPSTNKLTMPMKVEYCSANCTTTPVFIANPLDSLTPLAVGTFLLSSQTGGLAAYTTAKLTLGGAAFASGLQSVDVAKPASAGSMDVEYNLAAMTYLQTGATYTQNPKARATFGIYRNPSQLVYMREAY